MIEFLYKKLQELTNSVIELGKLNTWNKIPIQCQYILSEIRLDLSFLDAFEEWRFYKRENLKKKLCDLDEIVSKLSPLYEDIYDINVEIFRVKKNYTIIEVRYLLKTSFDKDYYEEVKNREPMFHAKLLIPNYSVPYLDGLRTKKFDINWKFKEIKYRWNMFLMGIKIKKYKWEKEKERRKKLNSDNRS